MDNGQDCRTSMTKVGMPSRPGLSRRTILGLASAFGASTPIAMAGVARAWTAMKIGPFPDEFPVCRAAMAGEGLRAAASAHACLECDAACTVAAPVAKERGVFAKHNLDVDFVNFGGSTEQLLEAIATGKADAGLGLALRWLKPLEQGFDVRITAGVHGGCIRLLGSKAAEYRPAWNPCAARPSPSAIRRAQRRTSSRSSSPKRASIRSRTSSGASTRPICLRSPSTRAKCRRSPTIDPRTYLWLKDGKLNEIATNLSGEYADRTCCVLAIRGSLIREECRWRPRLTRSILEAGDRVASDPADAAAVYSGYGGKGSVEDLAAMLGATPITIIPIGAALKKQISCFTPMNSKQVNVHQAKHRSGQVRRAGLCSMS